MPRHAQDKHTQDKHREKLKKYTFLQDMGLSKDEVEALREEHGMYVVGDSRINIAGLSGGRHVPFAAAVAKVLAG